MVSHSQILKSSDFKAKVRVLALLSRAAGIVYRDIPKVLWSLQVKHSLQELNTLKASRSITEAKRRQYSRAADVSKLITFILGEGRASLCATDSVTYEFTTQILRGVAGEAYRDDTKLMFAFSQEYRSPSVVASLLAYADADATYADEETGNFHPLFVQSKEERHLLNQQIRNGKVAEIDLLCASGNRSHRGGPHAKKIPGSGSLMLVRFLLKLASMKKKGRPRYEAVITTIATDSKGKKQSENLFLRNGFKKVKAWYKDTETGRWSETDSGTPYYVLQGTSQKSWVEVFLEKLEAQDLYGSRSTWLKELCPVDPKTGITYCQ